MTGFDMSESIVPKSDQINAEHLLAAPATVTITEVRKGSSEQPVNVLLAEFPGLPFRPSKTVRRIMVAAWGPDASTYVGKRMTLFNDPSVRWAGQAVGGIRVSHMSGIKTPLTLALTVTKGKRETTTVQPLPDTPQPVPSRGPSPLDALMAALKANGLTEAGPALEFISNTVGRDVKATKELTSDEVDLVVHELTNAPGGAA